jgi:hypothetical protein
MARSESGAWSKAGITVALASSCVMLAGAVAAVMGARQRAPMPSGVRVVVIANALVLGFLALELSDRIVRQDGRLIYWTTFMLPPALLLYYGLLNARTWSWRAARIGAAIGVLWFLGFLVLIPFADLQRDGVTVPWQGRVYVTIVTLCFAGVLAAAFRSLGKSETRTWFAQ